MPIRRKEGESKEEFVSRCIPIEVNAGKSQEQAAAICYSYYEEKQLMAVKNIRRKQLFAKVSIDYDDTLSTDRGKELAKRLISEGNDVYIISARRDKEGMLSVAKDLGIPSSRVYATGSNKAKVEKVKQLGIKRHIDNNSDVVKELPKVGQKFMSEVFENFEKQRVFVDSSNVERMMWNSDTKLLTIKFHDGSVYDYEDIEEELFLRVAEGDAAPTTTGSNEYGSWTENEKPSVGAAVHQLLINEGKKGKKTSKANPFR